MKAHMFGILFSPFLLLAQEKGAAWTNIGPSPAAVNAITVDPHGTGTIFMGTISGGVRRSVDGGATWAPANTGLPSPIVIAMAIDADRPQTVYAAIGGGGGLLKSDDTGATWRSIPAISGSVISVATDPNRSGVVYASVINNLANGTIRKSVDGGVTWTTIFPSTAAIFDITIDRGNSDVLYAPTVGHGAFKSTDGGKNWSLMPALTPAAIWTLALDPTNNQILYAGTNEDGIWKSTDAGNTWRRAGSAGGFPVRSLMVDPSAVHTLYAGTNGGGLWTSVDGGENWQSSGLANQMVLALAMDATEAVYVGTSSAGAQVSRDRGATWTPIRAGIDGINRFGYGVWIDPGEGAKLFLSSEFGYGLDWSRDGGSSWSVAGQGFTGYGSRSVAFDPSDSRRIYAGAMIGNALFKSTDGGLNWSRRRFGSPAVYVIAVVVDPLNPSIVYAGTQNEGIFKSTDYGETWKATGSGLSGAITYLTADPVNSGRVFASTATAFYLSENGAETWTNILNRPAWTITIDPRTPTTVYATTRTQGVFRSLDGSRTWREINNGLASLTMGRSAPVIIDPTNPQTLYVASEEAGVFKSLDGGDHWFGVNSGLTELAVDGLAMDPKNPAILYACGPNGVYRTAIGAEIQSPSVAIAAVVNGASLLPGAISPGEIVVLTGSGLGPGQLVVATAGANGIYTDQLSGTSAQFNGIAAPVIYTSATQVAVQVPESIPPGLARIVVTYSGRASASFPVQVTQYSPGVFTLDFSGKGQAIALNQDGAINSGSVPARVGEVMSLYATGLGDGDVTVKIANQSALLTSVKKIGAVVQIGVRLPGGIQTGGTVPVTVQVAASVSQPGVTIAVLPAAVTQTATNASIGLATAVTADEAGNVYFIASNSVFRVDPKGILTRIAGNLQPGYSGDGGPAISAQLYTDDLVNESPLFGIPSGMAVDQNGNVYVSDGGNARVRRISPDGIITTVAGNGVHGYTGDGGQARAAQLSNPRGLAVDSAGNLYIADTGAVRVVSAAGTIRTAAPFGGVGVTVNGRGDLYLVDYSRVRKISVEGTVTTVAGGTGIIGDAGDGGPATGAAFIGPMTVAIGPGGDLYIGDVGRIRKVSPDGIINTIAGGGKSNPGDGGPATSAQIAVESIAIDASGNLYVAGYGRVRKVAADGTITTVAGNGN